MRTGYAMVQPTHMGAIASVRSALSGVQELSLAKLQALVASSDSLRSVQRSFA